MFEQSGQLSMDICSIKCDLMPISKLNTRLHGFHAYQTVYFLFTMAFYDTNLPVGYILHRHDGDLVHETRRTASRLALRFSSHQKPCLHLVGE